MHELYFILNHRRGKEAALVNGSTPPLNNCWVRRIGNLEQLRRRDGCLAASPVGKGHEEVYWEVHYATFLELTHDAEAAGCKSQTDGCAR